MSAEDAEINQVVAEVSKLSLEDNKDEAKKFDLDAEIAGIKSVGDYPKDVEILKDIITKFHSGDIKNIIVMTGAGISVSAGIPDFRTPGTGLYDNLKKYKLPYPEAIFDIEYFPKHPKAFFTLAKELYPGNFNPTPAHFFIKLLEKKQVLLRNFTQNIDGLERVAGIDPDMLVEAHGTFATAKCIECGAKYEQELVKKEIFDDKVPMCTSKGCKKGIIKPDIVFFGESLPDLFHRRSSSDFKKCDLLIVMGTSLQVQPFASLTGNVPASCPRILINREPAGNDGMGFLFGGGSRSSLSFQKSSNTRDVFLQSDCDDGVRTLARLLQLEGDFDSIIKEHKAKL